MRFEKADANCLDSIYRTDLKHEVNRVPVPVKQTKLFTFNLFQRPIFVSLQNFLIRCKLFSLPRCNTTQTFQFAWLENILFATQYMLLLTSIAPTATASRHLSQHAVQSHLG
jgi:hypothetical protein